MKTAFFSAFGLLCFCGAGYFFPHPNLPFEAKAKAVTPTHGGTIAQFDFTSQKTWPEKYAVVGSHAVKWANVGTVDVENGKEPSGGLLFTAKNGADAEFASGKLPVSSRETNLGKLTLSFSLSASSSEAINVIIESFDKNKKRTGGLAGQIFPAAPKFYQRYALDLSTMKAFGRGKFNPTDPFVQFSFGPRSQDAAADYELRLDNINYASPAYYVSPKGDDKNDGRGETTAFATPQKALDLTQPGDIVVLMEGTYKEGLKPVASFPRPGLPSAWIVLKNYPNQTPTIFSNGWNIVSIAKGSKVKPSDEPALAYLEMRGLHVRGEGDVAKTKYPDAMNKPDSRTNSNGIAIDGRFSNHVFHDIRIADNVVEFAPGGGISSIDGDWVTVENNVCNSNCWTMIYAGSGISVMGAANSDGQEANVYKRLVRNNVCYHNQTFEKWHAINRYSDGNGIILDVNQGSDAHPTFKYTGRTLVQNNLCYDNGGSGIHTVTADRVDIIGNTVYLNSASVNLEYGEIFTYGSHDVRIMNNIMVAPVANVAAGEKPEPVNKLGGKNTNVVFGHNVYFGGNIAPTLGEGDTIADPQFVKPASNGKTADFHLKGGSPAIGAGVQTPFAPFLNLDNKPRGPKPNIGAY